MPLRKGTRSAPAAGENCVISNVRVVCVEDAPPPHAATLTLKIRAENKVKDAEDMVEDAEDMVEDAEDTVKDAARG